MAIFGFNPLKPAKGSKTSPKAAAKKAVAQKAKLKKDKGGCEFC